MMCLVGLASLLLSMIWLAGLASLLHGSQLHLLSSGITGGLPHTYTWHLFGCGDQTLVLTYGKHIYY